MSEAAFTIITDGKPVEVPARLDGEHVLLSAPTVESTLGWTLRPEGLCKDGACVPVADRDALAVGGEIDLAALARTLARPLAVDLEHRAAVLGAAAGERARPLASLEAPDFTLPDLDGKPHSLSEHRGKKVLLVAHASW